MENTLIVWAGDKAHVAPDFLAVVDFDPGSATYGKILRTVPLPSSLPTGVAGSNGAIGNEPHHLGVSADRQTLALGGLLSLLRKQDQAFFFDISDPRHPSFIRSEDPPDASIADEFKPLADGGFLTTFMGGPDGGDPGRLVEFDATNHFVKAWPVKPPTDGFNPHGIAFDEQANLLLTSDFICPLHTLKGSGETAIFRGSVRVWNLEQRSIVKTIPVGDPDKPAGTINIELIPNDRRHRAYTGGVNDGKLYLVDPGQGTARAVFDFSVFAIPKAPVWPHLFRINRRGTRLYITLNYAGAAGKVVALNIEKPRRPRVQDVVDLGPGSGPHYLALSKDEKRLVVADYFLAEDLSPPGVVQVEGDHKVHVLDIGRRRLRLDRRFDLDFNRDVRSGAARPHSFALLHAAQH